jgi:hypothetical protein
MTPAALVGEMMRTRRAVGKVRESRSAKSCAVSAGAARGMKEAEQLRERAV